MNRRDAVDLVTKILDRHPLTFSGTKEARESLIQDFASRFMEIDTGGSRDHQFSTEFQLAMHALSSFMHRSYVIQYPELIIKFKSDRDRSVFLNLLKQEAQHHWGITIGHHDTLFQFNGIDVKVST